MNSVSCFINPVTTADVAKRYFDSITAPKKEYVLLPKTGHDANEVMIDAQYNVLKNRVVPLVKWTSNSASVP